MEKMYKMKRLLEKLLYAIFEIGQNDYNFKIVLGVLAQYD